MKDRISQIYIVCNKGFPDQGTELEPVQAYNQNNILASCSLCHYKTKQKNLHVMETL